MNHQNHLKGLIDQSSLSESDKSKWQGIAASVPVFYASQLVYLIEQIPQGLEWLNQNLKDKIEVMKSKDKGAWQEFLNKEKTDIKNLLKA